MSSSPICFLPGLLKISANVTRGLRRGGGGGGLVDAIKKGSGKTTTVFWNFHSPL